MIFYPKDIKSKIIVFFNGKPIKPLLATAIDMSTVEGEEYQGWIDVIPFFKTKEGMYKLDEYENVHWLCNDTTLEDEYYEYNRIAKETGQRLIPRPEPAIWRKYGKIKWHVVR